MSSDEDLIDEHLKNLAERFTAWELVEELGLDVWDVIEAFRDECIELVIKR